MEFFSKYTLIGLPLILSGSCKSGTTNEENSRKPNIILIYTDDVGYGDISCYGATSVKTPEIDRLAENGLRFTNAYATSATCTPSRYGLLTGTYPWRKEGTSIAKGDAAMIISPGTKTIPSILKDQRYVTGVVGKWHLGLGSDGGPDWNSEITPGPSAIGFEYSFIIPATGDRVPCVFVENGRVVGLDPDDPIEVSYKTPVGVEPTGIEHPELLKMQYSHGHNQTIVNGISRLGYMSGGHAALWRDEDIADTLTQKALNFIEENSEKPFFLYFSTHDIHVPRVPHERFAGKNEMGPRGDVILELDWCVGQIVKKVNDLNLSRETLIIFSSDNGPVIDDGYHDQSVEKLGNHKPAGPFRGAKYSAYEGGTRIPFIVYWPGKVNPGVSSAQFSQVDLLSTLATLSGHENADILSVDSRNFLPTLLGENSTGKDFIVQQNAQSTLSLIKNHWKYIEPSDRIEINQNTIPPIELGNNRTPQLYFLSDDKGEMYNLAESHPQKVQELKSLLDSIKMIK